MSLPHPHNARHARWIVGCLLLTLAYGSQAGTRRALLIGIDHYSPPVGASVPIPTGPHAQDSRFAPGTTWVNLSGPLVDVDSMRVLLQQTFQFSEVRVLPEAEATRAGILAAILQLTAETKPGDFDVIYYSGHGSRRVDSLSSKFHFDETIVPIDAWKGVEDIRDKELSKLFDAIVYGKHAHLTAIFDSCDSGTMARGITGTVTRALPYDDRDVAIERKRNPATVIEADLKQLPQAGDAIIVAGAQADQPAVEALYSDDQQWHGAFTRALVHVLRAARQTLSAADTISSVSEVMHADPVQFQQPSVEGRVRESLFGDPVDVHGLSTHVSRVSGSTVKLDLGSAAGFDVGTQFTSIGGGVSGAQTELRVIRIDAPLVSTAMVVSGPEPKLGQTFELSQLSYPTAARLTLFMAPPASNIPDVSTSASKTFPNLTWVSDPAETRAEYLVVRGVGGWTAYDRHGLVHAMPGELKGKAYLLLGPPASLREDLQQTTPFKQGAFVLSSTLSGADYLLGVRERPGGGREYALIDPSVITAPLSAMWVRSAESDPDDAALNGGMPLNVVCRNDLSLPIRTGWLPETSVNGNQIVAGLLRRVVRLGRLRTWLRAKEFAPGLTGWPYRPEITKLNSDEAIHGELRPGDEYALSLVTTADRRSHQTPVPKYVYAFGFDCAANAYLLYPKENMNGDATLPQPGTNGVYPLSIGLGIQEQVATPLGADTIFFLVTAQKLQDPNVLVEDATTGSSRGVGSSFEQLVSAMNDSGMRGPVEIPNDWTVQQLLIPSRP
jgi:hypothetical protein